MGKTKWRSEPTDVEKSADELWLGVKCQSSSELAGSPRNALRRSGTSKSEGVKHCFAAGGESCTKARQTQNTSCEGTSKTVGDKLHRQEGNSPDHQLRSPNIRSVTKEVGVHRQPGGLPRSSNP